MRRRVYPRYTGAPAIPASSRSAIIKIGLIAHGRGCAAPRVASLPWHRVVNMACHVYYRVNTDNVSHRRPTCISVHPCLRPCLLHAHAELHGQRQGLAPAARDGPGARASLADALGPGASLEAPDVTATTSRTGGPRVFSTSSETVTAKLNPS